MPPRRRHAWGVLLLLAALSGLLHAEQVSLDPQAEQTDLSARMALLRDPERRLGIDDVAGRPDEFHAASRRDLVTSFDAGVVWLRLNLHNPGEHPLTRWLVVGTAKTIHVGLYQHDGTGWQALQSGRGVARAAKPIVATAPVFPVTLPPGTTREILLRVDARGATDMATTVWEPAAYRFQDNRRQMLLTALLGGFVLSSLLALLVFAHLRETQYLWLGLMLLGVAGLEASRENFLATYLWSERLALPPETLALLAGLALFSLSKVVAHALDLARWLPAGCRLLRVLRWCGVGGALIALASYGHGVRIVSLALVAHNLATLLFSVLYWRRGHAAARLFLLAFSLALLTETARQLANLGLLPWIAAMEFSTFFFLLASPLILLGLAEQTRQLTERLHVAEHLQQAKSAFLAKISHELRSPLNTILGYNRMLARGTAKLTLAEGTAGIEKSSLRLLGLIDELLDEARAAAGQLTIAPAPLSPRPWLDDICSTFKINAEATNNRFLCATSGELPALIEVDGERLRQVLDNLLNNANRHTRQGTITLACSAQIVGQEALLDFSVADDGEGIPADRLPVIFEPFVRGHIASERGLDGSGFGLGLPICRELIRQMGSDIAVTSAPGKGSRFSFSLRCRIVAMENVHPHAPPALPPDAGRPRVLLVDDEAAQLGLLTDLFAQSGFAVGAAAGGRAAIALLDQADWDVLITDQTMPGVDGWSVLRRARAARPELPVILLSAMEPCRPADFPADMRFDAILLKPASPEDVLATAWLLILKVGSGGTVPAWATLARLAGEGDVSGIEDWIAACRAAAPEHEHSMRWVEDNLRRLNLPLLERFAELAAHRSGTPL